MTVYAVRHAKSGANIYGGPAFGQPDAELTDEGRIQAIHLGPILELDYGIDIQGTEVATSTYARTIETAQRAGFQLLKSYSVLDEIQGLSIEEKIRIRETGILPKLVLNEAEKTLMSPPTEKVWFSHGLRLAGICEILGVYQEFVRRPYPRYAEIRELPL